MKPNLICLIVFSLCLGLSAQTNTENYIKTTTYRAPSTGAITENDTLVTVTYFDGLGRPKQTVAVRAGGQGQDIVTPVVYDAYGRQTKDYLPYAAPTQGGFIHPDPVSEAEAYYNAKYPGTVNPYSENILEHSPLNRVLKQGAPGASWQADPTSDNDHSVKFSYATNSAGEVALFKALTTADHYSTGLSTYIPALENSGFYNAGRLYKTITRDENWQPGDDKLHTTEEFKDFQGRIVLKRTYNTPLLGEPEGTVAHDTYYVYDKFGNLTFVIPPKVTISDGVSAEELNELCYQYVYDHRNRLVESKTPGKGWEHIVYNKLDQPVFTRDQQLQGQNKWRFSKYDKFGRVIYTGLYGSNLSREALQTALEGYTPLYEHKADTPTSIDGTNVYYSNDAFPDTGLELLTIRYYDRYNFDLDGGVPEDAYGITPTTKTMTLSTGNKTRVLGTNQWITTVTYYDEKARPVYTYTRNDYLGVTDKVKNKVNFAGEVLESNAEHIRDGLASITTIEKFTYDPTGRLLKHTHQIAGHPEETLAEHGYDELGQLIQKKVGNNVANPLQTVDYSYNIRGWLTQINDVNTLGDDLFGFQLHYNNPTGGMPLYNGNISQVRWRTNNTDSSVKHYNYTYDALSRITAATDNTGNYNLSGVTYDKNGNILSLNRQGHTNEEATQFGVMDNLVYSYDNGNKLLKVEDTASDSYGFKDDAVAAADNSDDYSYDINGNVISDTNKNITGITYNHLNLPVEIVFNNDQSRKISYIYSADGIKQRKVVTDNAAITTTDYTGNYIYENSSLKFFNHAEGYIEPDGAGGYDYVYQYKDFWKNVRVSYSDANGDGVVMPSEIRREQNYYPFGLAHRGYNGSTSGVKNNLKTYQGQEFTEDLELNIHEWKYRISDPTIGRFWQIDPLAEEYTYNSTYAFQENKMGLGIELEGLELHYVNPIEAWNAAKGVGRAIKEYAVGTVETLKTINPMSMSGKVGMAETILNVSANFAADPEGFVDNFAENIENMVNTELAKGIEGETYLAATAALIVLDPSPGGEMSATTRTAKVLDKVGDASSVSKKTDFVVTSNGTTIPIPDGATGPSNPNKGTGMVYQGGSGGKGMDKRTTGVRIMDSSGKQGRRVNYMNNSRPTPQTVDPATGRTISNKDPRGHLPIPIDPNF